MGPVFRIERRAGERRWQSYAGRTAFAGVLLIALTVVWGNELGSDQAVLTHQALAKVGVKFYMAILATAIPMVLLGAPAATSGAICIDKTRGTLSHMLTTDLKPAEIVLGKLFASLMPTLAWIAAGLPVAALAALLGGVDPNALLGMVFLMVGLAFLGCTLALMLSVWVQKPHEALLMVYLLFGFWILGPTLWDEAVRTVSFIPARPDWLKFEPISLAFAPFMRSNNVELSEYLWFCFIMTLVSSIFVAIAIWRLRPAYLNGLNRAPRKGMLAGIGMKRSTLRRWTGWLPGPRLDWNPVFWREWHYQRLTRWGWAIRCGLIFLGGSFVFMAVLESVNLGPKLFGGPVRGANAVFVNGFLVPVGLVFVCVASASVLSEERDRGNLDVLMATPMSTPQIVLGKWLGAYRQVVLICLTPTLLGFWLILVGCPLNRSVGGGGRGFWSEHIGIWITAVAGALTLCFYVLAYGAMLVSLGFGFAVWLKRGSRIAAVVAHVALTIGLFMTALLFTRNGPVDKNAFLFHASSFAAPILLTIQIVDPTGPESRDMEWIWGWVWIVLYSSVAASLLYAVLTSFDRVVGRIPARRAFGAWEWSEASGDRNRSRSSNPSSSPWEAPNLIRPRAVPPPLPTSQRTLEIVKGIEPTS